MRLLSGANLAKEDEDESQAAIREWSGLTAGPELDSILKGLRSPETRQETGPSRLEGGASPLSADGLRLVAIRRSPGTGRLPGRRHGPRQDRPGDLAAARSEARQAEKREPARRAGVADRELEIGAGEVRAESLLRRGPSFGSECERRRNRARRCRHVRSDHHHVRHARPQRLDEAVSLAAGDPRRSPGDQELRHEADPGREGIDRRQSDRHDRHARRESPFGSLVALRFLEPRAAGHGQAIRLVRQAVARRRRFRRSNRCEISCDPTFCGG